MAAFQVVQINNDNPHIIDRCIINMRASAIDVDTVFKILCKCERQWQDLNQFYWNENDIRTNRDGAYLTTEDYVYHVWIC